MNENENMISEEKMDLLEASKESAAKLSEAAGALAETIKEIAEYVPTVWVDSSEPDIDAEKLNHIEEGIRNATDAVNSAIGSITQLNSDLTAIAPSDNNIRLRSGKAILVDLGDMFSIQYLTNQDNANYYRMLTFKAAGITYEVNGPNGYAGQVFVGGNYIGKTNVNVLTLDPGRYYLYAGVTEGLPEQGDFYCETFSYDNAYKTIRLFPAASGKPYFYFAKCIHGVWQGWEKYSGALI